MIETKADLKYYLECDRLSLGYHIRKPRFLKDEIWRFERLLRRREFYTNGASNRFEKILFKIIDIVLHFRYKHLQFKLGFSIPLNVFGPGLAIVHYGTIVVAEGARIGNNCRIHEGVTIGATNGSSNAPVLDDNVFIGSGAKLIGSIHICSDVQIAANAVVVKDIDQVGTWGGVPARLISENNSSLNLTKGTELIRKS